MGDWVHNDVSPSDSLFITFIAPVVTNLDTAGVVWQQMLITSLLDLKLPRSAKLVCGFSLGYKIVEFEAGLVFDKAIFQSFR